MSLSKDMLFLLFKGQTTTVCIHFTPMNKRMSFDITVDDYSVVAITGAYNYF